MIEYANEAGGIAAVHKRPSDYKPNFRPDAAAETNALLSLLVEQVAKLNSSISTLRAKEKLSDTTENL